MARRPRGDGPHYVDLHVGGRIRSRRKAERLSLEALAAELGVTHQQMQKYETGANRITVSTLFQIAVALRTEVGEFLAELPSPAVVAKLDARARDELERFLASPGGPDLMAAFITLPAQLQRPFVAMARASASLEPAGDTAVPLPPPTNAADAES
jgi:transcriptional regulator with XRE-family HTH domain